MFWSTKTLASNQDMKVSKVLYHWTLSLDSFGFCDTQYLHFITCVFGHSAIAPFLGGFKYLYTLTKDPTFEI